MSRAADEITQHLRSRGHRVTPQRRAVIDQVLSSRGHISAVDVAREVRKVAPDVNESTIYRTLDLLEDVGFLAHSHSGSGALYHLADRHDHAHLICRRCRRETSVPLAEMSGITSSVVRKTGFLPDFAHSAIWGLCARCRRRAAPRASARKR